MHDLRQRYFPLGRSEWHLRCFFSQVPVLPARAVVPVKEMHYSAHIEIQVIAVLNRA
jgi:enamine deaminase RidA (YjgF/YER057c/UK114 family)